MPHERDIFEAIKMFDSTALQHLLGRAPDPVVARLIQIAPAHIRGRLFGGADKDRMERNIKPLLERESAADPEKDAIVRQALAKFTNDLIREGRIVREDAFYIGR